MKQFKDSSGRQWELNLTIDSVKRVRDMLGVNLLAPEEGDPPLITKLGTDEILLCDVIYCLIKPQADAQGITDEQFGQSLGPEAVMAAVDAFYEELTDFFQRRGRPDRSKAVAAQRKMIAAAVSRADRYISGMDIDKETERIFGGLSIGSPVSQESTPDH